MVPQRPGDLFGLNDQTKLFHSRLMKRVGVPPRIPFRQGIEKVQIGIFFNANIFPRISRKRYGVFWSTMLAMRSA